MFFSSKALTYFGTLMTTVTFFPANSHVEAVSGGTGVRPFQLGVESNLKEGSVHSIALT